MVKLAVAHCRQLEVCCDNVHSNPLKIYQAHSTGGARPCLLRQSWRNFTPGSVCPGTTVMEALFSKELQSVRTIRQVGGERLWWSKGEILQLHFAD